MRGRPCPEELAQRMVGYIALNVSFLMSTTSITAYNLETSKIFPVPKTNYRGMKTFGGMDVQLRAFINSALD
jgi:hypothetical protein